MFLSLDTFVATVAAASHVQHTHPTHTLINIPHADQDFTSCIIKLTTHYLSHICWFITFSHSCVNSEPQFDLRGPNLLTCKHLLTLLFSMQLRMLIYKQGSQQELLTWLLSCQTEEQRASRPYPGGVTHLWLNVALRNELLSWSFVNKQANVSGFKEKLHVQDLCKGCWELEVSH